MNLLKKKDGSKHLAFVSTDANKEVLKTYWVWDEIKNKIETINDDKTSEYGKDFMKIKFDSNDDLPLNKPLKFPTMTIIVRSVFEGNGKYYPQLCLDEYLYEL